MAVQKKVPCCGKSKDLNPSILLNYLCQYLYIYLNYVSQYFSSCFNISINILNASET